MTSELNSGFFYLRLDTQVRTLNGIAEFAGLDIAKLENDGLVPAALAAAVLQPRCCEVCQHKSKASLWCRAATQDSVKIVRIV